jgi:uncharacterized protein YeaO (DUF488 family)
MLQAKTISEKPGKDDGYRLLIAYEWPAGKSASFADGFNPSLAPSKGIYGALLSGKLKREEFDAKYMLELDLQKERLLKLKKQAKKFQITLVCLPDLEGKSTGAAIIKKCESLQ